MADLGAAHDVGKAGIFGRRRPVAEIAIEADVSVKPIKQPVHLFR
jgi:hypothetical protein